MIAITTADIPFTVHGAADPLTEIHGAILAAGVLILLVLAAALLLMLLLFMVLGPLGYFTSGTRRALQRQTKSAAKAQAEENRNNQRPKASPGPRHLSRPVKGRF